MKPRIRTIKPEAHLDEDLWDAEQETGLPLFRAFTGLWCHADREGRFEWRPRPLKAGILPYWEGDFSRVLDALATRGFIVKYASGGREYGYIRTFKGHQFINNREPASSLPDPQETVSSCEDARVTGASPTRDGRAPDAPIPSLPDPDPFPKGGAGGNPEPEPTRLPTRRADAERIPIELRCRLALRNPHDADHASPGQWPEVRAVAQAFHAAMGFGKPRLGGMGDSGVRAIVERFAEGYGLDELERAMAAAPSQPMFQGGKPKGLASLTAEVVRRLVEGTPRVPEGPDAETAAAARKAAEARRAESLRRAREELRANQEAES